MTDNFELKLSNFVKETLKERDDTHGYEHLENVSRNTKIILKTIPEIEKDEKLTKLTLTVAWLHDVNDHKYEDSDHNSKKMRTFLLDQYDEKEVDMVFNIVDRISYSKEIKEKSDWEEVLGETGTLIRNIVSDADKIEAIGEVGLKRCISYVMNIHFEKNKKVAEKEWLKDAVVEHTNAKLLKLKNEFIKTSKGKEIATVLHDELISALDNIDFYINEEYKKF